MRAICEYTKRQGLCKGCINKEVLCQQAGDCADELAKIHLNHNSKKDMNK